MLNKALLFMAGEFEFNFVEVASATFVVGDTGTSLGWANGGGSLVEQNNIELSAIFKGEGIIQVNVKKPYDDELFPNGIVVECKGALYKATYAAMQGQDYSGYLAHLFNGEDATLTLGETVTLRFHSL